MDWENPLRSIAATVDADVLKVLAGAHEAVTGNQLARLAGRSYAQVYAVVGRMVDEGLVTCDRYGRTKVYRLNRDHDLGHGIVRILAAPGRIESEIRQLTVAWDPPAESVALIGSAARRRTPPDGDVDLLVVRPLTVSRNEPRWRTQVLDLTRRIEALSGNPVQLTEVDRVDLRQAAGSEDALGKLLRIGVRTLGGQRLVMPSGEGGAGAVR
jgi:predicted nucleotidyltransferase